MPAMFPFTVTTATASGATAPLFNSEPTLQKRDIAIDLQTGRWIIENLDVVLTTGNQAIKQAIDLTINLFLGEYFPDVTEGTPWYESIFIKPASAQVVANILRSRILTVAGVVSCSVVKFSLDPATRNASIEYSVNTDTGQIVSSTKVVI